MKMIRHGFDRDGADIGGEVSVQRAKPLALGEPAIGPEAGDLSDGTFSWRCHPAYCVPSYSRTSLNVVILWKEKKEL